MDKKMPLEEEMALWELRDNDFFGTFLSYVEKELDGYLPEEMTEYGFTTNPIKSFRTCYALDGNINTIFNELCYYLQEYDYCNLVHPSWSNHIDLAKKVCEFAKVNNLIIKFHEAYL